MVELEDKLPVLENANVILEFSDLESVVCSL